MEQTGEGFNKDQVMKGLINACDHVEITWIIHQD
jgi:hypothetical protein